MRDGWTEYRLADLASVERGVSWSREQELTVPKTGSSPVVRIGNVQPDGIDMADRLHITGVSGHDRSRKAISPSTILMVGSNGNPDRVGNAYLATPDIIGHLYASFLIGIHATDLGLARYLVLWLQSDAVQRLITEATSGSTGLKNIGLTWLRAMALDLPPLAEQRRIVDMLDAADAVISLSMDVARIAGQSAVAVTNEAADNADSFVSLGDEAVAKGGKRLPKGTPWAGQPNEHPYIRVVDMKGGRIKDDALVHVPEEVWPSIRRYVVEAQDVIISIVGTIGEVALVPSHLAGANLTENAALIRAQSSLSPAFLTAYLRSERGRSEIERLTVGTTQAKLALFRIRSIQVPNLPLHQQQSVAALHDALQDVAVAAESQATSLRTLRTTLLSALMSGDAELPASYDRLLDGAA